jgi:hypothetical protein
MAQLHRLSMDHYPDVVTHIFRFLPPGLEKFISKTHHARAGQDRASYFHLLSGSFDDLLYYRNFSIGNPPKAVFHALVETKQCRTLHRLYEGKYAFPYSDALLCAAVKHDQLAAITALCAREYKGRGDQGYHLLLYVPNEDSFYVRRKLHNTRRWFPEFFDLVQTPKVAMAVLRGAAINEQEWEVGRLLLLNATARSHWKVAEAVWAKLGAILVRTKSLFDYDLAGPKNGVTRIFSALMYEHNRMSLEERTWYRAHMSAELWEEVVDLRREEKYSSDESSGDDED